LRTAVIGYLLAMLIGSVIGAIVSRIPPLRAATGSMISGLQTMPSIAWLPFAIILFGTSESAILFVMVLGAGPSIANGLITGSTTRRRCCCGRGGPWVCAASRCTGT
jgi:NitT/TauT family transport system permease protein